MHFDFILDYPVVAEMTIGEGSMRIAYGKKIRKKRVIILVFIGITLLGGLCPLIFFTCKKIYSWSKDYFVQSCKIEKIDISWCDVSLTMPRQKLFDYMHEKMTDANFLFFDHKKFYSDLKSNFGWVKDISWKRNDLHHVQCNVVGYKPVCCINDGMLVIENGMLMLQNQCDHDLVISLPSVVIDQRLLQHSLLDEQTLSFCKTFNPVWLNEYSMTYRESNEIIIQPKKYRHITLIADQESLNEPKKFQAIELILKDLNNKKILYFSKWFEQQFSFMLDLRFKDRIVVKRFARAKESVR